MNECKKHKFMFFFSCGSCLQGSHTIHSTIEIFGRRNNNKWNAISRKEGLLLVEIFFFQWHLRRDETSSLGRHTKLSRNSVVEICTCIHVTCLLMNDFHLSLSSFLSRVRLNFCRNRLMKTFQRCSEGMSSIWNCLAGIWSPKLAYCCDEKVRNNWFSHSE